MADPNYIKHKEEKAAHKAKKAILIIKTAEYNQYKEQKKKHQTAKEEQKRIKHEDPEYQAKKQAKKEKEAKDKAARKAARKEQENANPKVHHQDVFH